MQMYKFKTKYSKIIIKEKTVLKGKVLLLNINKRNLLVKTMSRILSNTVIRQILFF